MKIEELEALDREIEAELRDIAAKIGCIHEPITDGAVDYATYLSSSPRVLWILKEPWEVLEEGEIGGGWNVAKEAPTILQRDKKDRGALAMMAYIAYAVSNGHRRWQQVPNASDDPDVASAMKRLAYINVSKFPGAKTSNSAKISEQYQHAKHLLKKQIDALKPDIIIGGATLWLFLEDLGLIRDMFNDELSAHFCQVGGRLYIDAYHPAQWSTVKPEKYFEDIVELIFRHFPSPEPSPPQLN